MRLRSFLRTSSKNSSVSRIIDTFSKWSNSGYKMWLGSVASISRSASHWPTKFSVKAAALGLASKRSTCCSRTSGRLSFCCSASVNSSSSGIVLQRKYDNRLARAKSSSFPGCSRRNRNSGEIKHALQGSPHRRLERITVRQLGLDDGHERRDVVSGHGPAKRPAREGLEDSLGIDHGLDPRRPPRGRRSCYP